MEEEDIDADGLRMMIMEVDAVPIEKMDFAFNFGNVMLGGGKGDVNVDMDMDDAEELDIVDMRSEALRD